MLNTRSTVTLAGALALFVGMAFALHGGFTDDGFIHIQYARNLVEHGQYAFNPGETSFGTTSPLWVMALAAFGRVFGSGEQLIAISRVLSWLSGVGAVAVFFFLMRRVAPQAVAVAATFAFAADAWFVRWTALSMETASAVLAVAIVCLLSLDAARDRRHAALLGVAIALASLVRPEVYLAVPVWIVVAATRGDERRNVMITLGVCAALLVPWLLFARLHIGSFLPNTAGAKSGGIVLSPVELVARFSPIVRIVAATQALSVLGALLSLVWFRRRSVVFDPRMRFLALWTAALPAAYVLFDIQVLSRYMLLTLPSLCALGWCGWGQIVRGRPGGRFLPGALSAASVAANIVFYALVVLPPSRAFSSDLQVRMKSLARYIDANAADSAVVAAADIGYLAFYSNRRVLDLGGLVEPETGKLRERYDYEDIVANARYFDVPGYPHVDYLVDREKVDGRFDGVVMARRRFTRVYGVVVRNLGIRKPGPWYYTLYKIEEAGE